MRKTPRARSRSRCIARLSARSLWQPIQPVGREFALDGRAVCGIDSVACLSFLLRLPPLRKFIAFLLALLLPLQTLAGLAMPWQVAAPSSGAQVGTHCTADAVAAASDAQLDDASTAAGEASCEHCAICHLAGAGVLPASARVPTGGPRQSVLVVRGEAQPASHLPEEPNPPPVAIRF